MELPWDIETVKQKLGLAFEHELETELLAILKENSFLFVELFSRKSSPCPIFREVELGTQLRCDFVWLNDNSDGPEWVLVEVEKPGLKLFRKDGMITSEFSKAIEQVRSWQQYFNEQPAEKRNIFGAVKSFRFILVAGNKSDWEAKDAVKWRMNFNNTHPSIEIRSMDVFWRAIDLYEKDKAYDFSSSDPKTLPSTKLKPFWEGYGYIQFFRSIMD